MAASAPKTSGTPGRSWSGEVWGGFAAMLVALPSSIAFGVAVYAPLGPSYLATGATTGILGAIVLGTVAPLLGGAPRLISSPCAPAAAVLAALATDLAHGGGHLTVTVPVERIPVLLLLVALLSAALQLAYGVVGGGKLIKFIPYPVVSGYLSGVAVLIFLSQLPKLLGLAKGVPLWAGALSPAQWQWPAVTVGCVTAASMVLANRLTKALPGAILGLGAGLVTYFALGFAEPALWRLDHNPLLIGQITSSGGVFWTSLGQRWTAISGVSWGDFQLILMPALTLSALLSIDTLKTCVVVDALTRSRHKSNRELLGQGAGNLASALVGGMPGAGTMGATLVNLHSGGKTRLSGLFEGLFALVAFLAVGRFVGWVPVAALAGILMVVAFRMFDRSSFRLLKHKATVVDFVVIAAVVLAAVWMNLIAAAGVGLALAILLFIRDQMRGSVIRRKVYGHQISSKQRRLPPEKEILVAHGHQTVICELQGSLFFGTTDRLFTELEPDLKRCQYVILDMRRVQSVDFTAAHMLQQIEATLTERQARLLFSQLPASLPTGQDLELYFNQLGLVRSSDTVKLFDTLDDALEWVEDRTLEQVQAFQARSEQPLALAEIDLLRGVSPLGELETRVKVKSFAAGQPIFQRGDPGDEMFLIRRGVVRIHLPLGNGKHVNLAGFGRGDFFGDMAFLDQSVRSADALAATSVDLYVISRASFDEFIKSHPALAARVLLRLARALAIRLRHTDNELRALQEC